MRQRRPKYRGEELARDTQAKRGPDQVGRENEGDADRYPDFFVHFSSVVSLTRASQPEFHS